MASVLPQNCVPGPGIDGVTLSNVWSGGAEQNGLLFSIRMQTARPFWQQTGMALLWKTRRVHDSFRVLLQGNCWCSCRAWVLLRMSNCDSGPNSEAHHHLFPRTKPDDKNPILMRCEDAFRGLARRHNAVRDWAAVQTPCVAERRDLL